MIQRNSLSADDNIYIYIYIVTTIFIYSQIHLCVSPCLCVHVYVCMYMWKFVCVGGCIIYAPIFLPTYSPTIFCLPIRQPFSAGGHISIIFFLSLSLFSRLFKAITSPIDCWFWLFQARPRHKGDNPWQPKPRMAFHATTTLQLSSPSPLFFGAQKKKKKKKKKKTKEIEHKRLSTFSLIFPGNSAPAFCQCGVCN